MSNDLPPWAQKQKEREQQAPLRPPGKRPFWLMMLGVAMLLSGGKLLINGGTLLSNGGNMRVSAETVAASQDMQALVDAENKVYQAHPAALRAHALAKIAMALLTLFAVAAVFSSDVRARSAVLLVAWAGIVFELGEAAFAVAVLRPEMASIGPVWSQVSVRSGGQPLTPDMAQLLFDARTGLRALLGIGFSVLLLRFFGGRRGRLFFGVGADLVTRQPNHGG